MILISMNDEYMQRFLPHFYINQFIYSNLFKASITFYFILIIAKK